MSKIELDMLMQFSSEKAPEVLFMRVKAIDHLKQEVLMSIVYTSISNVGQREYSFTMESIFKELQDGSCRVCNDEEADLLETLYG
jgi:hypothetical protein